MLSNACLASRGTLPPTRFKTDGAIVRVNIGYLLPPPELNLLKLYSWSSPFVHQMQALEAATAGRDLFVSTGTGSGKTECFMLPLLAKLAVEAHDSPSTWERRGYPLNAPVSDQISRLRRLIGNRDRKFAEIFRDVCGQEVRRPQFGMYTGRTPYPGSKSDRTQDRQLAQTLRSIVETDDEAFLNRLSTDGKIPSKADIDKFIVELENGKHVTDAEDAELITRFEMQKVCPDILITNASTVGLCAQKCIVDSRGAIDGGIFDGTTARVLDFARAR